MAFESNQQIRQRRWGLG